MNESERVADKNYKIFVDGAEMENQLEKGQSPRICNIIKEAKMEKIWKIVLPDLCRFSG